MSGKPDPRPEKTGKRPRTDADRRAAEAFKRAVLALDRECLVHGDPAECDEPLQAHHVIPQQTLRKAGRHDLLWDPANGMTVCYRAHRRDHSGHEKIPFMAIPTRCLRFAADHGFADVLAHRYFSPPSA